jgi:cell division protein FtsW
MFRSIGERFNLNPSRKLKTTSRRRTKPAKNRVTESRGRTLHLKFDVILFLSVIILTVFGMIMVYSSSYDFSQTEWGDSGHIFRRQLLVLGLGIIAMVVLAYFDYHKFKDFALPGLIIIIISLFAVLIIGDERHGAARSLFNGSVQPSEFAKLAIVLYLSVWLYAKRERLNNITFGLIPLAVILGVMSAFVLLQPDISAVFTIMFLGVVMFIVAGGDLRQIGFVLILAILAAWLTLQLFPTGAQRMEEFILGLRNPSEASYHVRRSFEAFVNGGWSGVGIGNSTTKVTGLPVPHTDSVYAVVGEETGMVGAVGLLVLFLLVLWRGLTIARRAPDEMGALMAAGLSIWLAFEAFINMAGIVNVVPFAGNALPFISAGGSSLFVCMVAIGILLNISRLSIVKDDEKGSLFSAVIDLRRRDGRGSVPRARRSTGAEVKR